MQMDMPSGTSDTDAPFLDHPRRERIYNTLQERPGLNWNQLQRETGLSVGALLFHLDKLEEAEAVVRKPATNDKEVLFFTKDNVDLWKDPSTRVLFGNDSTRRVAQAIHDEPGSSANDIAERLDIHPVTVRYHVDKLDDHKLLYDEKEGRSRLFYPTDRLSDWLEEYRPD